MGVMVGGIGVCVDVGMTVAVADGMGSDVGVCVVNRLLLHAAMNNAISSDAGF
jgi:hypothetical protein